MSNNSKNLTYEAKEPSFLRRLKQQYEDGDSDRRRIPNNRPKKHSAEDEDDEPLYVDEESNTTYSKTEFDALVASEGQSEGKDKTGLEVSAVNEKDTENSETDRTIEAKLPPKKQKVAGIGGPTKRNSGKMIAEGRADDEAVPEPTSVRPQKSTKKSSSKRVKLSFHDE